MIKGSATTPRPAQAPRQIPQPADAREVAAACTRAAELLEGPQVAEA